MNTKSGVPPFVSPFPENATPSGGLTVNTADLESATVKVPAPVPVNLTPGTIRTFSAETTVYTTQQRRRAIDVFLSLDSAFVIPKTGVFVVRVYARSRAAGSARALVSSGMLGFCGAGGQVVLNASGLWVCAGRAVAEVFEVTLQYYDTAFPFPSGGNVNVTCVASDHASDLVPDSLGTVLASGTGESGSAIDLGFTAAGKISIPKVEVIEVGGINTSTSARYLQLFSRTASLAVGTVPDFVWPLGATAGSGYSAKPRYRCPSGFILAASSTAGTYTNVADCFVQALIR